MKSPYTPNQKAACYRLALQPNGQGKVRQVTAEALVRKGLAIWIGSGGTLELTRTGRRLGKGLL